MHSFYIWQCILHITMHTHLLRPKGDYSVPRVYTRVLYVYIREKVREKVLVSKTMDCLDYTICIIRKS